MLKLLVFDLDGTLADTSHDLAVSVNNALGRAGHSPLPLATVVGFLGDGARTLITRSLMASADGETSAGEIDDALAAFLEYYRDHCLIKTHLYPGVDSSLAALASYRKTVLTNKPEAAAKKVLSGLGLASRFIRIVGGDNPFGAKPEPGALWRMMEQEGVEPGETLMIGDGLQDFTLAKRAGTRFLGFTGGLAPAQALIKAEPEAVLGDMADLARAVADLAAGIGAGTEGRA